MSNIKTDLSHPIHNIKPRIDSSEDVLSKLKTSLIGGFYFKYLKHCLFVRDIIIWAWPIYLKCNHIYLFHKKKKCWQQLIKLHEVVEKRGLVVIKLFDAAKVNTPLPEVIPFNEQLLLGSLHRSYDFPEIYITVIEDSIICGGSNLIISNNETICHDLYDFKRDGTSEELHGRIFINADINKICWLVHDDAPVHIHEAANFVDACASNYAHWLTEVLPRIAVFCSDERFKNIPIIVNANLHENIMASLFLITGEKRDVITLPISRSVFVDKLYVTSVAGYIPFSKRNNKLSGHSHGIFSPNAMKIMREQLFFLLDSMAPQSWPEKIYIRRNSGIRKVSNSAELEELLINNGFVIIEPEKLSVMQQIQIFSHAKIIIGSSGAALANVIFSSCSSKIYILISKCSDMIYGYWQNMACASNKKINYIFGEIKKNKKGIHSDFVVNPNLLLQIIT